MYNWYQFITAVIQHIYECKLQYILTMIIYIATASSGIGCIYTHIAITYVHGASFVPLAITYYSP